MKDTFLATKKPKVKPKKLTGIKTVKITQTVKKTPRKLTKLLLPHELTRDDFHNHLVGCGNQEQTILIRTMVQKVFSHTNRVHDSYWGGRDFRPFHKFFVQEALKDDKKISRKVLDDYPDL